MSTDPAPALAAIHYERDFDINGLLRSFVAQLRTHDVTVGGVIQEARRVADETCVRLHVVDLRSGKSACISQNRGKDARGCKLDPRGLADISHCITDAIAAKVDLIVINKFGRAESEGAGLLSCIADAISVGVPVLTTVREPYLDAWGLFHGGLARDLPPRLDAILHWHDVVCRRSAEVV